jgi:hypothetical protein
MNPARTGRSSFPQSLANARMGRQWCSQGKHMTGLSEVDSTRLRFSPAIRALHGFGHFCANKPPRIKEGLPKIILL